MLFTSAKDTFLRWKPLHTNVGVTESVEAHTKIEHIFLTVFVNKCTYA